mgnify:CR=1 FL=1
MGWLTTSTSQSISVKHIMRLVSVPCVIQHTQFTLTCQYKGECLMMDTLNIVLDLVLVVLNLTVRDRTVQTVRCRGTRGWRHEKAVAALSCGSDASTDGSKKNRSDRSKTKRIISHGRQSSLGAA